MATKVLGFIELIWTCDSCGTRNPGPIKSCTACGAPQPPNVQFEKVDQATFDFIKDEALIRQAKSGPDKHCPYCGTRNLSVAKTCIKCGSDLTIGAPTREHGAILEQKPAPPPVRTPAKASPVMLAILALVLIGMCVLGGIFMSRASQKNTMVGTVASTNWRRSVQVMGYREVQASAWEDQVPTNDRILSCSLRHRYNSEQPVPNSQEVCGEPYTVDTGTGIGEVRQDCIYEVYDDYCTYATMAWTLVDTLSLTGSDLYAVWPTAQLTSNERLGDQSESYQITFSANNETYSITTTDYALYQMASPGSRWNLTVNGLGALTDIEPQR